MPGLNVKQMLDLPWSWKGPKEVVEGDSKHYEMRIEELSDFFLAGASHDEVLRELRAALEAYLGSYLERGEQPPLPSGGRWHVVLVGGGQRSMAAEKASTGTAYTPLVSAPSA